MNVEPVPDAADAPEVFAGAAEVAVDAAIDVAGVGGGGVKVGAWLIATDDELDKIDEVAAGGVTAPAVDDCDGPSTTTRSMDLMRSATD